MYEVYREISPELYIALQGPFHPVALVSLDWPNDPVNAHSGVGILQYGGFDWIGTGEIGSMDVPEERGGIVAVEAELKLMGIPPTIYDLADVPIRGHLGEIYFGATTERGGNVLIGDPCLLFSGAMDSMKFPVQRDDDGNIEFGIKITIRAGVDARGAANIVHSAEDQKLNFPTDTAGRLLINNKFEIEKITWPET